MTCLGCLLNFMTGIPSFTRMADIIGSLDSERESVFPSDFCYESAEEFPNRKSVENIWKWRNYSGGRFLWLAFEFCGRGGLFVSWRSEQTLGSHVSRLSFLSCWELFVWMRVVFPVSWVRMSNRDWLTLRLNMSYSPSWKYLRFGHQVP